MISDEIQESILQHTIKEYPKEMCGVIAGGVFIPITNISTSYGGDDEESFVMCPKEYSKVEDSFKIDAIVHSHPDWKATPSLYDKARCNQGDIPWVIMSYPDIDLTITHPQKEVPLIGRDFVHGFQDCYTLIQDYYERVLGIKLSDYEREDEWWEKGDNLYLDNYKEEGFYEVDDLKIGDMILMQIESNTTNHAAIMYDDNVILHHLYGRPSCLGIYGGYWRDKTTRVLRHKNYRGVLNEEG